MNVLHIGIKFWPHSITVLKNKRLKGVRGGGMNKYCDILINAMPSDVNSFVIVQMVPGQSRRETFGNVTAYRTRTFGSRGVRQIVANLRSFFIGIRIIRKHQIDLIHGHMETGIFTAWVLSRLFRKPIIGTPYSFATVGLNVITGAIIRFVESITYRNIDRIVFESNENREQAHKKRGLKFTHDTVIHTGIPLPVRTAPKKAPGSVIRLLYLGRLVPIKATDNLIKAMALLPNELAERVHLDIVGEGELFQYLSSLIAENNLDQHVTLHGYVDDNRLFFEESDIFILPSYQEGLSVSLLEAMSYGLACIINNFGVPFSKESVYEMHDNDPSTIARAISAVAGDIALLHALQQRARAEIAAGYSVERFAEQYYHEYQQLIR